MESTLALLVPFAAFALLFGIVYLGVTSDNKKNLAMIEAGMNPNEKPVDKRKNLRTGLLLIFVPLGLFIGNYFGESSGKFFSSTGIITAFLFGGIALLLFYFIDNGAEKNEKNN